ncbi:MAG: hypothetical protein GYB53_23860 [Rhodobacteraceae bacterium]|nr:hypothetical protein [Paracoccaceae bacterium]MBR9823700.1 hypothetical protein [Paracoccaceae bacterium]
MTPDELTANRARALQRAREAREPALRIFFTAAAEVLGDALKRLELEEETIDA